MTNKKLAVPYDYAIYPYPIAYLRVKCRRIRTELKFLVARIKNFYS